MTRPRRCFAPRYDFELPDSQPLIAGLLVWLIETGRTTSQELRRKQYNRQADRVYRFFDGKLPRDGHTRPHPPGARSREGTGGPERTGPGGP